MFPAVFSHKEAQKAQNNFTETQSYVVDPVSTVTR